jgi:cytochrome c-type protein NapB
VNATEHPTPARARGASLLAMFVLGGALVGYLLGIKSPPPLARTAHAARVEGAARPAPSYAQLLTVRTNSPAPGGTSDPPARTEEATLSALADRAKNRAYDGAPPTIPHPIDGMRNAASCLACHGSGLKIGETVATKVSHPHFTNCVQCHTPGAPPELAKFAAVDQDNRFTGAQRSGPGSRAWPGAPPTIPHTTWMRQDCMSCHGPVSRPGLRTPHPWLANCTQCHATSAALDQVAFPLPLNGGAP